MSGTELLGHATKCSPGERPPRRNAAQHMREIPGLCASRGEHTGDPSYRQCPPAGPKEHMGISLKTEVLHAFRSHRITGHLSKLASGGHMSCPELRSSFLHTRHPVGQSTHPSPTLKIFSPPFLHLVMCYSGILRFGAGFPPSFS